MAEPPPVVVVPPPGTGQVSEGTKANFSAYAPPGRSISEDTDSDGSGSPLAASPDTCAATLSLAWSAAPTATAPTWPAPVTVQAVPETLETRKVP